MTFERINPPELAPAVGFSHAVRGTGTLVVLAGQTALDRHGAIVGEDVVAQFQVALGNLLTALSAAGGQPDQIAGLTVFSVDLDDYRRHAAKIGDVWRSLVGREYPAMAAVGVTRLWDELALVELQGLAILPSSLRQGQGV